MILNLIKFNINEISKFKIYAGETNEIPH